MAFKRSSVQSRPAPPELNQGLRVKSKPFFVAQCQKLFPVIFIIFLRNAMRTNIIIALIAAVVVTFCSESTWVILRYGIIPSEVVAHVVGTTTGAFLVCYFLVWLVRKFIMKK